MKEAARRVILASLAALLASGCSGARRSAAKDGSRPSAVDGAAPGAAGSEQEPAAHGLEFARVAELQDVRFGYDSSQLDEAARAALKRNAEWLKEHRDAVVQVAGHCDERGTTEYNLALGQRRATATRDYYRMLGIPGKRVATISFGKEKPSCSEAAESCWSANRRAETRVRRADNRQAER